MHSSSILLSGILLFHGPSSVLGEVPFNGISSLGLPTQSGAKEPSFLDGLAYSNHGLQGSPASQDLLISDPLSDSGNPPPRSSGGGRAPCSSLMVAMVPGTGTFSEGEDCVEASDAILAYSSDSRPQFWIYVPDGYDPGMTLKLQVMRNYHLVAEQDFPMPTEAGLISIELDYALEPGLTYTWIAEVMVTTGRGRASNPRSGGLVQYRPVEPEFLAQMDGLPPLDRAQQYGEEGFWYEALNELAVLRRAEPDNAEVLSVWRGLLASYGLEIFAEQPFLDCCQVTD